MLLHFHLLKIGSTLPKIGKGVNIWILLKNNYKIQTILLVRQVLKLFSFLAIQVQ